MFASSPTLITYDHLCVLRSSIVLLLALLSHLCCLAASFSFSFSFSLPCLLLLLLPHAARCTAVCSSITVTAQYVRRPCCRRPAHPVDCSLTCFSCRRRRQRQQRRRWSVKVAITPDFSAIDHSGNCLHRTVPGYASWHLKSASNLPLLLLSRRSIRSLASSAYSLASRIA